MYVEILTTSLIHHTNETRAGDTFPRLYILSYDLCDRNLDNILSTNLFYLKDHGIDHAL